MRERERERSSSSPWSSHPGGLVNGVVMLLLVCVMHFDAHFQNHPKRRYLDLDPILGNCIIYNCSLQSTLD